MKKRLSFLLAVGMIIASAFPGVANATTIDDLEQATSEENETGDAEAAELAVSGGHFLPPLL